MSKTKSQLQEEIKRLKSENNILKAQIGLAISDINIVDCWEQIRTSAINRLVWTINDYDKIQKKALLLFNFEDDTSRGLLLLLPRDSYECPSLIIATEVAEDLWQITDNDHYVNI